MTGWYRFFAKLHVYYVLRRSDLFDPSYYFLRYPDVRAADIDPIYHYIVYGAQEKRNPSDCFDTSYYLETNPDVNERHLNPLYHFIRYGQAEGRQPLNKNSNRAFRDNATVRYGMALMDASVEKRLSNINNYVSQIGEYIKQRKIRKSTSKIVVYTAIVNGYDSLKLPEVLEPEFDYVVYTNIALPDTGIWQVRPLPVEFEDPTRSCRYVKTHPQKLLGEYDLAVWMDSNIMIVDRIYPDIALFLRVAEVVAAIPHPHRKSIYEEVEACKELFKDCDTLMVEQINYYLQLGFNHDDLIESNFMMFKLKDHRVHEFLDTWWKQIEKFSRRDQLSLNFALNKHRIAWHRITPFPNSARNHPALAFLMHDGGKSSMSCLIEALREKKSYQHIDVVVPVYNALEDVKKCLNALEIYQDGFNLQVIIVNDASNSETTDWLRRYSEVKKGVILIDHLQNQGYTKAVNSGLKQVQADYVIALNSDTLVTQGWLRGLCDCINSSPKIGIVGPLSNAASWQSVPVLMDNDGFKINELPHGFTPTSFASLVCKVSEKCYPRVNVINGFCFMIKREVIDSIGYMDEINFPIGYGEENDYCIRAANSGFELAIADDAYVYHSKSKSFGHGQRKALSQKGTEALIRLHGKQRLESLTHNLKQHPVLDRVRQELMCELAGHTSEKIEAPKTAVIIPELTASGGLAGSAYVRLVEPYINSKLFNVAQISIHSQPQLPEPGSAHYVILQRSLSKFQYDKLEGWLLRWRQSGGDIIYDLDDDLLDYEGVAARTGRTSEAFTHMANKIELVISHARYVTVSTQALRDKLANKNLNVYLLPNFLNELSWPRLKAAHLKPAIKQVRIGYIGTSTHSQDLILIAKIVQRLEKEYGDKIKVQVIGAFENKTPYFGEKIVVSEKSNYPDFIAWLQETVHWDIGLIPLVEDTFNRSKSHVKFLEYAALGLAIVCSKGETYRTIAEDRKNCLVVENTESHWYEAIKKLIEEPEVRKSIAEQARRDVVKSFTIQANAGMYKEIIH